MHAVRSKRAMQTKHILYLLVDWACGKPVLFFAFPMLVSVSGSVTLKRFIRKMSTTAPLEGSERIAYK